MTLLPSFPLLARELTERAAQRRTYVLRVIYAALLFAPFAAAYIRFAQRESVSAFGLGRQLFVVLTAFQFGGIYLLLPAIMCGAITREKERDSLSLLLLTRLTPGEIILQKYFGGLVPMFSFLLLSLPLAALAYSMGGLGLRDLALGGLLLLLAALQVAAFALFASVWCRSTAGALFLAFALCFSWPLLRIVDACTFVMIPAEPFALDVVFFPPFGWVHYWRGDLPALIVAHLATQGLAVPLLLLLCARLFLIRRAFLPPQRGLHRLARRFDGLARRLNRRLGTMIFPQGERSLPGHRPIAWLESTRSVLAHPDHVMRIALLLECVAGPVALNLALLNSRKAALGLDVLFALFAVMALLVGAMLGANAFVTERVKQTFDVLLTTPLDVRQMIREKASIVYRLMLAGLVPIGTIVGIAALQRIARDEIAAEVTIVDAMTAIGAFMIDLSLVWWLALWLSMKARSRLSGMMFALAGVLAVLALPSLVMLAALITGYQSQELYDLTVLFSPLEMLRMIGGYGQPGLPAAYRLALPIVHLGIFGALLCMVKQRCLDRAEYYLRG